MITYTGLLMSCPGPDTIKNISREEQEVLQYPDFILILPKKWMFILKILTDFSNPDQILIILIILTHWQLCMH